MPRSPRTGEVVVETDTFVEVARKGVLTAPLLKLELEGDEYLEHYSEKEANQFKWKAI